MSDAEEEVWVRMTRQDANFLVKHMAKYAHYQAKVAERSDGTERAEAASAIVERVHGLRRLIIAAKAAERSEE